MNCQICFYPTELCWLETGAYFTSSHDSWHVCLFLLQGGWSLHGMAGMVMARVLRQTWRTHHLLSAEKRKALAVNLHSQVDLFLLWSDKVIKRVNLCISTQILGKTSGHQKASG